VTGWRHDNERWRDTTIMKGDVQQRLWWRPLGHLSHSFSFKLPLGPWFSPLFFYFHLWNLDRLGLGLGLGWAPRRWAWTNPPLFLSSLSFIPSTCTFVVEPDHPSKSLTSRLARAWNMFYQGSVRLELPFRWIDKFIFMTRHVF
jgi:hypothetical protein